jgi:hypothetical protein
MKNDRSKNALFLRSVKWKDFLDVLYLIRFHKIEQLENSLRYPKAISRIETRIVFEIGHVYNQVGRVRQ